MNNRVYLAGPITGATYAGANDWREHFSNMLDVRGLVGVSPLRCEPLVGAVYAPHYSDIQFGTPEAIGAKNRWDVARCDATVAFLPKDESEVIGHTSIGTICEVNWAYDAGKLVMVISDIPYIRNNAVLKSFVPWFFPEDCGFELAAEVCEGILGVYNGD